MLETRSLRIGREIFLAALGLPLETVDSWVIDRLTTILDEQEVHAGQTLITADEAVEFIYFMQDGQVRFERAGKPPWTFQGRWFLGGFEAIGDRAPTRTATALNDFYAMRVRASQWVELLEDTFQLARPAVMNAARAVARLEERIPEGAPASSREASHLTTVPNGPLSLIERLALLLDVRMLRGAGVQALADLAAASQQVSFAAGQAIIEPGAEHGHLIFVVDGEVFAERTGPSVVRRYGPGDLVCGAAILGRAADEWNARALTPTRGIALPLEALFDLMEEHFDVVRSIFAALGARRELLLDYLGSASALVLR